MPWPQRPLRSRLTPCAAAGSPVCAGRVDRRMGRPGAGGGDEQKRGGVDGGAAEGLNGRRVP